MLRLVRLLVDFVSRFLQGIAVGGENNTPPSVQLLSPTSGVVGVPVPIRYVLTDAESDPVRLEVSFSTDGGTTFRTAREAANGSREGVTGLLSSPAGVSHLFVWDAGTDLPVSRVTGVLLRLQPFDTQPGNAVTSLPFDIVGNTPPSVQILAPTAGTVGTPVGIRYVLTDAESDPVRLEVSFSTDAGATFQPANEAVNASSDGITGLSSNPLGEMHLFAWDAVANLPTPQATNVLVRIQAFDSEPGGIDTTAPFHVDATIVGMPGVPRPPTPPPTAPTSAPEVQVFRPQNNFGPQVPARFLVSDPDNQRVDVSVEFSVAGRPFQPATPAATSDRMTDLAAPRLKADYRFIWDAVTDLGVTQGTAVLQMTPRRGTIVGQVDVTPPFSLDTRPRPPAATPRPLVPLVPLSFELLSGDNQVGMSGQLLPENLRLRVRNAQGNELRGARVSFISASGPAVEIEPDPAFWTTTNVDGIAAVRVRPKPGVTGAGLIEARVVGVPEPVAKFRYTVNQAQILHIPPPQSPLAYGRQYFLTIGYDGDGNMSTLEYQVDPLRPIKLNVEGTNVIVSHKELRIPRDDRGAAHSEVIAVVPTILEGTATIRVTHPTDSTVAPLEISLPVQTSPTARRRIARRFTASDFEPVQMFLKPLSGLQSDGTPQVGYSELTLATPLQVELTDERGIIYDKEAIGNLLGCDVDPVTQPLSLLFSVGAFTGGSGTLSTTPSPGANEQITVDIGRPVYFTPRGRGPWVIDIEVMPGFARQIADPDRRAIRFTDPSGNPQCYRENSMRRLRRIHFNVIVQEPSDIRLVEASGAGAPVVPPVKAGDRVRLEISGLSPTVGGTPTDVSLDSLKASGNQPPAYVGLPIPLAQNIPLQQVAGGSLQSEDILITQGNPVISVPASLAHAVIPGGWLRARIGGSLDLTVTLAGRVLERQRLGNIESLQETPQGTTPVGGAAGTVMLHNGEFVYTACDLTIRSRPGVITRCRTWRSHVKSDGPFGPGWQDEDGYLEVAGENGVRWCSGSGRYDDFTNDLPPKGFFVTLSRNLAIDADRSAFEIMDAHRNVVHFNVDGSLRFVRNRLGDEIAYKYNEKAQLIEMTDTLNRTIRMEYWQEGDGVAPETIGKRKRMTDFTGRVVDFAYYGTGDANGGPGWLKTVSWPAALTIVAGQQNPNYRRSETYIYAVDPNDRLQGKLLRMVDSEGRDYLVNREDRDGRLFEQDHGTGTFKFSYDAAARATLATDRVGNETRYWFPISPYCDAAAPIEHEVRTNRAVRPNEPDYTTRLVHNGDGLPVHLVAPAGDEWFFVYDEQAQGERSHGNLLALRHRATSRAERVWSYQYSARYNFVTRAVDPRGNAPGENAEMYAIYYTDDHQFGTGDQGKLERILLPRTLNAVIAPTAAGGRETRWLDENPVVRLTYNAHGRLVSWTDQQGVVTEYRYYPENDPTGVGGATPSVNGGGFLAAAERDVAVNPARELHLPGIPLDPQLTQWRYNLLGDVVEIEDPRGVVTRFEPNPLHEINQITQAAQAPAPLSPLSIVTNVFHSEIGAQVRAELEQPNASAAAGGPQLIDEWTTDHLGNVLAYAATLHQGRQVTERFVRDANDEIREYRPFDVESGRFPQASVGVELDERGLPAQVKDGAGTATPVTTQSSYSPNGWLQELVTPSGQLYTQHHNEYGESDGVVDPQGRVVRVIPEPDGVSTRAVFQHGANGGNPTRRFPAPPAAPVGAFTEIRRDELGRPRRGYYGLFVPDQPGTTTARSTPAQPIPPVPDRFPNVPGAPFPLPGSTALQDGPWGPNDGRITLDATYDAWNLVTRLVDDEIGFTTIRRDAHGRPIERSDASGNSVFYSYDKAGNLVEIWVENRSTDPLHPRTQTYRYKLEYDALGRTTRIIDGEGNAYRYEHDETGHVRRTFDTMGVDSSEQFNNATVNSNGNVTTYERDGLGRILKVETQLTTTGLGGAPLDTNPFNSTATVGAAFEYDEGGRLTTYTDQAGNQTQWGFDDDHGWPVSISYPPSAASAGQRTEARLTYDTAGRLETFTDANGTRLRWSYDELDRVVEIRVEARGTGVEGSTGFAFAYDGNGNLAQATDLTSGYEVLLSYDSAARLLKDMQGGNVIESEYDGVGNRTRLHYPDGGRVDYRYDQAHRLISVTDAGRIIASFEYLGNGRLINRTQNGITMSFTHSSGLGRLIGTRIEGFAAPVAFEYTLERDRLGRLTKRTRTMNGVTEVKEWRYDSAGRMVRETFTPAPARAPAPLATERLYDGDTVLRRETRDTVREGTIVQEVIDHDREERGRIIARNGTPLRYDRNGNLMDDGIQEYVYDAWNRLLRVERGGQVIAEYEYDALHRLIKRRAQGVAEAFVYDGWEIVEVRVSGAVRERYVYSGQLDDILTAEIAGQRYTVLYTPEGYVDALVDAQRNLVESYDYTLSGVVTVLDANRAPTGNAPISRFLFQRRPFDPVTGLYDYRRRWCHAAFALYLTAVLLSGLSDHYGLNNGDTVNRVDPFGLQDVPNAQPDRQSSYSRTPDGSYEYTATEIWKDCWSGVGLGLWANANQIPKVVSLGFYEGDLFGVPSDALNRMAYNRAVIPARIGQEAAFAAGTGGLSLYVKSAQGTAYSVRIARGTAVVLTAGELAGGGRDVIRGSYNFYQGEAGGLDIASGIISLLGAGLSARELKELLRSGRGTVVVIESSSDLGLAARPWLLEEVVPYQVRRTPKLVGEDADKVISETARFETVLRGNPPGRATELLESFVLPTGRQMRTVEDIDDKLRKIWRELTGARSGYDAGHRADLIVSPIQTGFENRLGRALLDAYKTGEGTYRGFRISRETAIWVIAGRVKDGERKGGLFVEQLSSANQAMGTQSRLASQAAGPNRRVRFIAPPGGR